ncbi:hypothetical protein RI129_011547 [Pyrocoelia pectoralis]
MTKNTFDYILQRIEPTIAKIHWSREPIPSATRLALTLRYLATGDSITSIAYSYRIGKATASKIIPEILKAIWNNFQMEVLPVPTEETWLSIASDYWIRWNFPNCIGAIDGKHVVLQAPPNSGSQYYNYKGQHSIILLAVCDAQYRFTMVDIGAFGRQSDGGVFKNSTFAQHIHQGSLNIPLPNALPNDGPCLPYVFIADEAFQLTEHMMRPYPRHRNGVLSIDKRVFNYRLSRARRVIENSFGILTAKWRIYRKPLNTSMTTAIAIVQGTICLHNLIIMNEKIPRTNANLNNEDTDNMLLHSVTNVGSNTYSRNSGGLRDSFKDYFVGKGSVPWQLEKAMNCSY